MRKVLIMLLAFMAYLGHAQQHKPLKIWQGTPERAASVTLTAYIPQGAGRDCPAVIVCPGGSYHWLDTRTEGDGVARWLNSQGIAAFVLRYRVAGVLAFITHYRLLIRGRQQPDMLRDVQRMMNLLPITQREVVFMRFYQNLSFKEIAELTNVSINTALGRMRYAVMNMRRMAAANGVALQLD